MLRLRSNPTSNPTFLATFEAASDGRNPKKAAPKLPTDDGESVTMMMPALISDEAKSKAKLNDLAIELVGRSAGFKRSLPEGTLTALAELVRVMNCYYSNLIEGHNTHPMAIERAMRK